MDQLWVFLPSLLVHDPKRMTFNFMLRPSAADLSEDVGAPQVSVWAEWEMSQLLVTLTGEDETMDGSSNQCGLGRMGMVSKETPGLLTTAQPGRVLRSLRELVGPRHLVEMQPNSKTGTKALTCLISPGALYSIWARV